MDIDANVRSVEKLRDFYFTVPDYQREYIWEADDQVEQFLFDIDAEYDPHASLSPSYFIGSIIIVGKNGRYDVIDGQQRLTTIVLSMCALRDILQGCQLSAKQSQYFDIVKQWLMYFDMESDETRVRLELQYEESKDFLARMIQGDAYEGGSTASIRRMQEAYTRLRFHFEQIRDEGVDALVAYAKYFLTRVELVVIESEDLGSALKIFETINQRGVGLNAMDLVKNLLFSKARESEFGQIKNTWRKLTKHLEDCGEGQSPLRFLKYFLVGRYHKGILREDEIYKWIISQEGKRVLPYEDEPLKVAQELERLAARYSELVSATEDIGKTSRFPHVSHVGYVNKYRSRQHLVLLLALPQVVGNDLLDYLGQQIESFLFFSNVMGIQGRTNEQLFARWAVHLRQADDQGKIDAAIRQTMLPYLRERQSDFRSSFSSISHTHFNPGYRQRFVLGQLENTMRRLAGMSEHGHAFIQSLQIEHVLPQTARDDAIPDEYEDRDDYRTVVSLLGNVTLLESMINQAVNNHNDLNGDWYKNKRTEYVKSDLVMTNLLDPDYQIGKNTGLNRVRERLAHFFPEWTRDSIERRQKLMLELAFETWRLCGERLDQASGAA